jgi:hypothetical protein
MQAAAGPNGPATINPARVFQAGRVTDQTARVTGPTEGAGFVCVQGGVEGAFGRP